MLKILRAAGLFTCWLETNYIFMIVCMAVNLYTVIACCVAFGTQLPFEELSTIGGVTSTLLSSIAVTIYFILLRRDMERFTSATDDLTRKFLDSDLGESGPFSEGFISDARFVNLVTTTVVAMTFVAPLLYCIPTPIICYFQQGDHRCRLPFKMYSALNHYSSPNYEIMFMVQLAGLWITSIQKVTTDCLFLAFFRIQVAYLKYLTIAIRSFQQLTQNQKLLHLKLIQWVKLHQDVLSHSHELVALYSPIIVTSYICSVSMIALGLFMQLKNSYSNLIQCAGICCYTSVNLIQLFIQCYTAQEMGDQEERLAKEIYKMTWYRMEKKNSSMLPLILQNAQCGVRVAAYRSMAFVLNKETFIALTTKSLSTFMGFNQINDLARGKD